MEQECGTDSPVSKHVAHRRSCRTRRDRLVCVSRETRMKKQCSIRELSECEEALMRRRREVRAGPFGDVSVHNTPLGVGRGLRCWSAIAHPMNHIIMRAARNQSTARTEGRSAENHMESKPHNCDSASSRSSAWARVSCETGGPQGGVRGGPEDCCETALVRPHEMFHVKHPPSRQATARALTSCRPGPARTPHARTEARTSPRPLHVSGPRVTPGSGGQHIVKRDFPPP